MANGTQQQINKLEKRVEELEEQLSKALERIEALENATTPARPGDKAIRPTDF